MRTPLPGPRALRALACLLLGAALGLGCAVFAARTPDSIGFTPEGQELRVAQFHGRLLVLNFWATWCAPCRAEMLRAEQFHRAFEKDGVDVVAVNYGEQPADVRRFLKLNPVLTLPVALDPGKRIAGRFRVDGLPTSVLLDWNGEVRWTQVGYGDDYSRELLAALNQLVAEHASLAAPAAAEPRAE